MRRKCLVRMHLKDGLSVEGFLTGRWGAHYVLKVAKFVEGDGKSQSLDGDVAVPKDNVSFFQRLGDK